MAILFMDSFHHHHSGDQGDLDSLYKWEKSGGNHGVGAAGPRANWRAMYINVNSRWISHTLDAAEDPLYTGFAHAIDAAAAYLGIRFHNDDGVQVSVYPSITDGKIRVYRGTSAGTLLGTTANREYENSQWLFIEIKTIIHSTTGAVEVKINGNQVLNLTGQNTQNSGTTNGINKIYVYGLGWITDWYIDDATFHGPIRVDCLYPDGAGNYSQFTPSAGSNYQNVDEQYNEDGDTTYNEADTIAEKDLYTFGNIPTISGAAIKGLAVNHFARKIDVGVTKIKNMVRMSSTDYPESTEQELQVDYRVFQTIWDDNPADSQAWEEADVNAVEAGLELTTV